MALSIQKLIEKYQKNQDFYRGKEIGDGTQGFSRDILESDIFALTPGNTKVSNTYRYEATRGDDGDRGDDFILNIDGIIVPVEVEMYENLKKGEWQIEKYMKRKNSLYGILTDGWTWRFYTRGYHGGYTTLTLDELATDEGKRKKNKLFEKKDYYLTSFTSLSTLVSQSEFIVEDFHADLIRLAEDVLSDFESAGAFGSGYDDGMRIKGVYSFIIQFILLKIIQDKKNIDLLGVDELVGLLEREEWNKLTQHIFRKLSFLAKFYTSYKNEQETILEKIRDKYSEEGIYEGELMALRPFLDLYVFIIRYNFKTVKQDIFGTVYENYLKERYREDDSKKGQVFTPPDIVEYMLEEVGYTEAYIRSAIESYGVGTIRSTLAQWAPIGKSEYSAEEIEKQYLNIPGLSIIDPACGSGTFLYKAASRIVNAINHLDLTSREKGLLAEALIINNIVGFDIEAFPLYLAEMNILMTLLYHNIDSEGNVINVIDHQIRIFSTTDSIAEFANSGETIVDTTIRAFRGDTQTNTILSKRDEEEILRIYLDIRDIDPDTIRTSIRKAYIREFISSKYHGELTRLYDKCPTLEEFEKKISIERIAETTEEEHTRKSIIAELKSKKTDLKNLDLKIDEIILKHETKRVKFDFVVGNPPYVKQVVNYDSKSLFGVNINLPIYAQINIGGKGVKIGNSSQNLYVYFYYLGYFLMKDGGKLCFITPRSLLQQPATHKLRQFLKIHTCIKNIRDFVDGSLFYGRGINSTILVATDSCIVTVEKSEQDYTTNYSTYTGNPGKIELTEFLDHHVDHAIVKNELFSFENKFTFFEYFDGLKTKNKDFHYSIYTGIFLSKNDDRTNTVGRGLPILYPEGYYFGSTDIVKYYDISDGIKENYSGKMEFPTTRDIISKKYKISWSGRFSSKEKKYFTFSDMPSIQDWDRCTSIGVNDIAHMPEMYFLFGILNSQRISHQIQKDFGGVCNMTNLRQLIFPRIDSPTQESLKQSLINNSEAIISLAKSLSGVRIYRDLYDTRIDGLDEVVGELSGEYAYMRDHLAPVMDMSTPLPKDIIKMLKSSSPDMQRLERERDRIVEEMYGV